MRRSATDRIICALQNMRFNHTLSTWRLKKARAEWRASECHTATEPLVSIVIPTYNRGRILAERTIPSILAQSYPRFEVVVVGDHVIDDSERRVLALGDQRIRFFDLPQRGRYPTDPSKRWFVQGTVPRNIGQKLASGSHLAFLSDDDVMLPDHLSTMVEFSNRSQAELVSAAHTIIRNGEIVRCNDSNGERALGFPVGGMPTWLARSYLSIFKWNTQSYRKSWNRPCDYDLLIRLRSCGVTMAYIDKVVAHLPAVEGSNSHGYTPNLPTQSQRQAY